jgi:pimeloyl-ACP methyl ester carboxylesterase
MADTLGAFPFWKISFNKDGIPADAATIDSFASEVKSLGLTDLFIFSHGWNNDESDATWLYEQFFGQVGKLMADTGVAKKKPAAKIGVAGVIWPSILWPDDAPSRGAEPDPELPAPATGGTVGFATTTAKIPTRAASVPDVKTALDKAYPDDVHQQTLINDLVGLLAAQPEDENAINTFRAKLGELLATEATGPIDASYPDDAEAGITTLNDKKWRALLREVADDAEERGANKGGVVGLGDDFKKLWSGAKDVLRVGTYWQMKKRAGVVGENGLAKVLVRLAETNPILRIHLLGHSFGARVVSFSLRGLSPTMTGPASPVKSLFLLQGAFSHNAFADQLPFDASRSGALKGMAARVDGPLLTTHSLRDYAVGVSYPAASMSNGEDAAAFDNPSGRWGAMGHDGAQGVAATKLPLSPVGFAYPFATSSWINLDGNQIIIHGQLPSGAHSDIVHPETAWAALSAAGIV